MLGTDVTPRPTVMVALADLSRQSADMSVVSLITLT